MVSPSTVHLHIRRVVIDAAALSGLPREKLLPELQAALAERLSGATGNAPKTNGVAGNIADAVVQRLGIRTRCRSSAMSLTSSPKLIKGGLVVMAPGGGAVQRTIALQYNPDTLTRSYQVQGVGGEGGGERAQPLRLKGPAIETIKLDAEIDATDQLEFPDSNANAVAFGIAPQLAVLEALVNPSVDELLGDDAQARSGTLEILPPEAPLVLFVWSKSRVVPVRVTEFSVTEEAFDPALNPIRAKVSLGLRVLTTDDLGFTHRGGTLFISYLRNARGAGRPRPAALACRRSVFQLR